MKCSIASCTQQFSTMRQVIQHLNDIHHQKLIMQTLKFCTEAAFADWLHMIENNDTCNYRLRRTNKRQSCEKSYYNCSRSGTSRCPSVRTKSTSERKRRLKSQGYNNIGRTCPAYIVKTLQHDGTVSVEYQCTHLCYTDIYKQLGHIRLCSTDRQWIAGKLSLGVPMQAILREVRNSPDGRLRRLQLLTKQDITNIERTYHLNKPERLHVDEIGAEDSDGDVDPNALHIGDSRDTDSDNTYEIKRQSEANAHQQQLSRPSTNLEMKKKRLEEYLLRTWLVIRSLTTCEEMEVAMLGLSNIDAQLKALRSKPNSTTLPTVAPLSSEKRTSLSSNVSVGAVNVLTDPTSLSAPSVF